MICTDSVLIQQDEPSLIGASVLPLAPTAEGQSLNGTARRVACDSGLHTGYMTYCRHQCPQDTVVVPTGHGRCPHTAPKLLFYADSCQAYGHWAKYLYTKLKDCILIGKYSQQILQ